MCYFSWGSSYRLSLSSSAVPRVGEAYFGFCACQKQNKAVYLSRIRLHSGLLNARELVHSQSAKKQRDSGWLQGFILKTGHFLPCSYCKNGWSALKPSNSDLGTGWCTALGVGDHMPRSPTCVLRANARISLNLVVVGLDFFGGGSFEVYSKIQ